MLEANILKAAHIFSTGETMPTERVVCVDDEPEILTALLRVLRDEPYELLTTTDPQQALRWVETRDISLIVADYKMPVMDGIDRLLAVQECSPTTQRLMMTAHPDHPVVLNGLYQGFLTLLAKPWSDDTLKVTIREQVLQRRRAEYQLQNISELERRRLGQDFHDTFGQDLVGLVLLCKGLELRLRSRGAEEVADVRKISEIAQKALSATRALARGLNPPNLTGSALVGCLKQLVASVRDTHKVDCRIEWDQGVVFSQVFSATQVYCIIHEALTSALRHANAGNIEIKANLTPDGVRIRVVDDGGSLPYSISEAAGIGLRIMKSRAQRIHADLKVEPAQEGGTQVVCEVPAYCLAEGNSNATVDPDALRP